MLPTFVTKLTHKKVTSIQLVPSEPSTLPLLKKLRTEHQFQARLGSLKLIQPFEGPSTLFLGLGKTQALSTEKVRRLGAQCYRILKGEQILKASLHSDNIAKKDGFLEAFLEGFALASYKPTKIQSKKPTPETPLTLCVAGGDTKALQHLFEKVLTIAACVQVTQNWSNLPPNIGTPDYYAKEAKKIAKEAGIKCTILDKKAQIKERMNLFLGVGAGSTLEGRIVILEYTPKKKATKTIALVGKGVTFDSGGISLKPPSRMEEMKHDMTGAATAFGATLAAAAMGSPHKIVTVLAFTENMPSGTAITPSHIITARNGKTVEIINTDAEGRLVLADALDYVQDKFQPHQIINIATLTGAVGIALGKLYCGIMGNNKAFTRQIKVASKQTNERVWELPLDPEFFQDIQSDYADMKNCSNSGLAGTIQGGMFLKQFIKNKTPWVHFDIGHVAYNLNHLPYCPSKGASGSMVRLLTELLLSKA